MKDSAQPMLPFLIQNLLFIRLVDGPSIKQNSRVSILEVSISFIFLSSPRWQERLELDFHNINSNLRHIMPAMQPEMEMFLIMNTEHSRGDSVLSRRKRRKKGWKEVHKPRSGTQKMKNFRFLIKRFSPRKGLEIPVCA
ncbi:hypothetical protein HS088_TW14G01126 [Tripterygium wilfordii]|uniref:Uncharacterized protein n=1 Tax=Tripterygium wilfordii TaxID=458696 RepID=A0A7J7CSC7_TRIWF|nr:hypothetical protein HS088_TW14G01126 [Tripterygium wilfordii]